MKINFVTGLLALFTLSTSVPVPDLLYHSIFILRGKPRSWILYVKSEICPTVAQVSDLCFMSNQRFAPQWLYSLYRPLCQFLICYATLFSSFGVNLVHGYFVDFLCLWWFYLFTIKPAKQAEWSQKGICIYQSLDSIFQQSNVRFFVCFIQFYSNFLSYFYISLRLGDLALNILSFCSSVN